jgi:hypothetical protein
MKLVGGKTQPIIAAVRGRAPSVGSTISSAGAFGISSTTGVRGGKAVAAGLSKSVGAAATGTVNTLRHVGENRLHLPGFAKDASPSRVAWFGDMDEPLLGVIDNGFFKMYKVRRSVDSQKNTRESHSVVGGKHVEVRLPANLQNPFDFTQFRTLDTDSKVTGFWALSSSIAHASTTKLKSHPLAQAEIESNPPYQPFYTDRRVNISVYATELAEGSTLQHQSSDQWVFGNDIPATKLYLRPPTRSDDGDEDATGDHPAGGGEIENLISLGSDPRNVDHVVITTRRKKMKKKKKGTASSTMASSPDMEEDGFFEDDCEVLDFARDRV